MTLARIGPTLSEYFYQLTMNKTILSISCAILYLFSANSSAYCQEVDSSDYKIFKRTLPFIMKSINADDRSGNAAERVSKDDFVAPWDLKKFEDAQINKFISILTSESNFELKEGRGDYTNLNIYATLQDYKLEPKVNKQFENIFIEISNFNIVNGAGENIYLSERNNILQPKNKGIQKVTMQGAQFNCLIPVTKDQTSLSGSIDLSIKEKGDFIHKGFSSNGAPEKFELNGNSFEFIKIEGNRAYFKSMQKVENLKFVSTNGDNKKHNQSSTIQLSEKVYLKALEENLSEDKIKDFVDTYSLEEFNNMKNEATMIIYQSSGDIDKVYLYQIAKFTERGKCTLNFKL